MCSLDATSPNLTPQSGTGAWDALPLCYARTVNLTILLSFLIMVSISNYTLSPVNICVCLIAFENKHMISLHHYPELSAMNIDICFYVNIYVGVFRYLHA